MSLNRLRYFINYISSFLKISKKIVCIGDSHTAVFHFINYDSWFSGYFFKTLVVHGATASGIENPNSKTQAKTKFDAFLDANNNKKSLVLFQLGEIDCGFVIWYRSTKYDESIDEQLKQTLHNYQSYILSVKRKSKQIIVMSAILPTIQDGQEYGEVANLRKEVKATLKERTALTLRFNDLMKIFCKQNNLLFLDLENQLLDQKSNTVKKQFLNDNPLDHHLSNKKFAPIILKELDKLFSK